jgi:hypothetical protein
MFHNTIHYSGADPATRIGEGHYNVEVHKRMGGLPIIAPQARFFLDRVRDEKHP